APAGGLVYHDPVVAGVEKRRVDRLGLAGQEARGLRGHLAENLAARVDHEPAALDRVLLGNVSRHGLSLTSDFRLFRRPWLLAKRAPQAPFGTRDANLRFLGHFGPFVNTESASQGSGSRTGASAGSSRRSRARRAKSSSASAMPSPSGTCATTAPQGSAIRAWPCDARPPPWGPPWA